MVQYRIVFPIYLLVLVLVFFLNVIPAFMPPTWIILSFLYLHYHLSFIPTVILGVIAATAGRVTLALIARRFADYLPKRFLGNYEHLGTYLQSNKRLTIPVVVGYAFSPISSNALFIMAGLSNLNLKIVAASFFVGRLISYSFWITSTRELSEHLEDIFQGHLSSGGTFISAAISLGLVYLIGRINWKKILKQ